MNGGQSKPAAVLKQHFSKGNVVCIDKNIVNTKSSDSPQNIMILC